MGKTQQISVELWVVIGLAILVGLAIISFAFYVFRIKDKTNKGTDKINESELDESALDEVALDESELDESALDEDALDEVALDESELDEGALDEGALDEGALDEGELYEGALDEDPIESHESWLNWNFLDEQYGNPAMNVFLNQLLGINKQIQKNMFNDLPHDDQVAFSQYLNRPENKQRLKQLHKSIRDRVNELVINSSGGKRRRRRRTRRRTRRRSSSRRPSHRKRGRK